MRAPCVVARVSFQFNPGGGGRFLSRTGEVGVLHFPFVEGKPEGKIGRAHILRKGTAMNEPGVKPGDLSHLRSGPMPFMPPEFMEKDPTEDDFRWALYNQELRPQYEGMFVAVW